MPKSMLDWVKTNTPNLEARDYQVEAWEALQKVRRKGRKRALIHLATGLGKTSVAAVDVSHYLKEENPNGRVLFVSHMNDISSQANNTFSFVDKKMTTGFLKTKALNVQVTFATFQSLFNRLNSIPSDYYSYIIYDEAHHIEAETFSAVRHHFTPEFSLALTATPERADGRSIFNYFGHPIYTKSLADGIKDGWLSPVDYHIVFDDAVKEAMEKKFEVKTLKEIRELFAIRSRNEVISKEVLKRRHDIGLDKAKTIVFCQNITSAVEMASLLGGEVYHSEVPLIEREKLMRRFKNGHLQVICTVDMFNEGIDIPDARLVVFLRSTSSKTIFEQQLGRGLRRAPGKDKVTVLDFVANVERINFVRELGRHVRPSKGGSNSSGGSSSAQGIVPTTSFNIASTFEFDDKAIEILKRYQELKSLEYLSTEEVVDTYNKFKSIQKTADHYGVTWQAIKKHLVKGGVDTVSHIKIRSYTDEQILEEYKKYGTAASTAKALGVDPTSLRARIRKAGGVINATNKPNYADEKLIMAYKKHGSVRAAAQAIGMGRSSAMKRLKNSGVDISRKYVYPVLSEEVLAEAYELHKNNINELVWSVRDTLDVKATSRQSKSNISWTTVYKALDKYGYLEKRPITQAIAAAAYYKYGTSIKAGEALGVSSALVSRRAKGAPYIRKFKEKEAK